MPPPPPSRKFSNLKALKRHFQHYQADSCIKNVPKIDRYSVTKERYHQLYYIFIINNYCHTPLMLAKYDTSFFTKDENVHSVLLSFVHLRSASLKLSRGKKDWSLVSHSVKV